MLRKLNVKGNLFLQAPVYQSAPVNCPPRSPDFFNTVVEITWDGTPAELLRQTQDVEQYLGRHFTGIPNAPRLIDLDVLYCGDACLTTTDLILPHPRMLQRRFVLQPLADIRPDLILPGDTITILKHLRHLDESVPELKLVQCNW